MHIKKRTVATIYRLIILILAVIAMWVEFANFQAAAWRLLTTWVLLLVAIYYFVMTIISAFFKKRSSRRSFSPMLQGMLLVAGVSMLVASTNGLQLSGLSDFANTLIVFILPALMLGDYFAFSKKGLWRTVEPFYWLALPVIYISLILITADFAGAHTKMIYPYPFLYYHQFGIDHMLWVFALMIVVILTIGYVLLILDFVASGEASKHIVMPRIKTVVIEEEIVDESAVTTQSKVEQSTKQVQSVKVMKPESKKQSNNTKATNIQKAVQRPVNKKPGHNNQNGRNSAKKSQPKPATSKKPAAAKAPATPKRAREDKASIDQKSTTDAKKAPVASGETDKTH